MQLELNGEVVNINTTYGPQLIGKCSEYIVRGNRRLLLTDGLLLLEACKTTNAKSIVEIGSMDGGSSLILGDFANSNDGLVWCIEPAPKARWMQNIREADLEKHVTLVRGASPWVSPVNVRTPIDVLFIDGDHRTTHEIADFIYWEPYVREGGVIVFHDYCGMKGVKEWVRRGIDIILEDYALYLTPESERGKLELFGKSTGSDRGAIAYKKVKA